MDSVGEHQPSNRNGGCDILDGPDRARFWCKVDRRGPDECWEWTASRSGNGYGIFWLGGKQKRAHRISWQLMNGAPPVGLVSDHLCRNRLCVNPSHIEFVTNRVNVLRGASGITGEPPPNKEIACINGHVRNDDNTYTRKNGLRECRVCHVERSRIRKRRIRKAVSIERNMERAMISARQPVTLKNDSQPGADGVG